MLRTVCGDVKAYMNYRQTCRRYGPMDIAFRGAGEAKAYATKDHYRFQNGWRRLLLGVHVERAPSLASTIPGRTTKRR